MGIRGELFSTRVTCEGRTYFFNVKENRMGDLYLTVVESKPTEAENFDRRSVVVFRDDVPQFLRAFQGALDFMAKPGDKVAAPAFKAPALAAKPRPRKAPAGFAGAGDQAEPALQSEGAKKRRVVVKRREAPKE
ncbi:MAG TPA: DUF3276 family protein [Spirochaetia bacterium]|nr:DUF3276 family protein [Spirochaetia bacterium]